jgi:hypothetical protein
VGVPTIPIETLGANGTTGTAEQNDEPPAVFTFDQEQNLLIRMNEQQGKTIEELLAKIKVLEQQLVEKPVPPICYVKCAHCVDAGDSD